MNVIGGYRRKHYTVNKLIDPDFTYSRQSLKNNQSFEIALHVQPVTLIKSVKTRKTDNLKIKITGNNYPLFFILTHVQVQVPNVQENAIKHLITTP